MIILFICIFYWWRGTFGGSSEYFPFHIVLYKLEKFSLLNSSIICEIIQKSENMFAVFTKGYVFVTNKIAFSVLFIYCCKCKYVYPVIQYCLKAITFSFYIISYHHQYHGMKLTFILLFCYPSYLFQQILSGRIEILLA